MKLEMDWDEIEKVIASGSAPRVLLFGPPGTGKTHLGSTKTNGEKQEVFSVTVTPEMSAAEIRGHYVPKGDGFRWIDGPGVAAWRKGGRLVLNEIDQASSDVMTMLHVILDDPQFARLTLPNEELELVRPAPGFTVVATMNAEKPDTVLPAALYDRFPVQIHVKTVNPKALAGLPTEFRAAASELAAHTDPNRRIGLRAWQAFAEMRKTLGEELAAKAVFRNKAVDVLTGLKLAK
jgi:MoxR-like ATPase